MNPRRRLLRTSLLLGALLLALTTAASAQLIPVGPEVTLHEPVDSCGHWSPVLTWIEKDETLAAWETYERLVFRRIAPGGALGLHQSRPFEAYGFAMTAGHDHPAVMVTNRTDIVVAGLDAFGNPVTPLKEIAANGVFLRPRVVRTPTGYAVAWDERVSFTRQRLHLALLDASFQTTATYSRDAQLSWSSDALTSLDDGSVVLAFHTSGAVSLQRLDPSGAPATEGVRVADGRRFSLASGHDQVAAVWLENATLEHVEFQLLDATSLAPNSAVLRVNESHSGAKPAPKILPTGQGWMVFWVGAGADATRANTLFVRSFDPDGRPLTDPLAISEPLAEQFGDSSIRYFDVSYTDTGVAAVWQIFRKLHIIPIAGPCETGYRLRTRRFQVAGAGPTDIPVLGPMGTTTIICLLVGAGWILLRRSA